MACFGLMWAVLVLADITKKKRQLYFLIKRRNSLVCPQALLWCRRSFASWVLFESTENSV
eukprot:12679400-Ditylum_brightwellii.AAC.1